MVLEFSWAEGPLTHRWVTLPIAGWMGVGYGLQRGPGGSGSRGTTRSGAVSVFGLLLEGVVGNDPELRHLRAWPDDVNVGGDDEVYDEEGVWQAPLGGEGSAIRHVNHDEFHPIDGGAVHDDMNRFQVLVEERCVAAIPRAENPGEDVEEEALLRWGRVDRRRPAVADEVGVPKLSNDHRLVVEDPIVATVRRDVVTLDWQPRDPCKGRQINLYVVEINATVDGVAVAVEIGVEGPDESGIVGRAALGDEGPQTRRLKLVVEFMIPLLLGEQLQEHSRQRDRALGEVREEPGEFLLRPELQEGSVKNPYDDDYQVDNGSDYYPYHEEPPYDTPSKNFGYSPCQDSDGDNYYEPHGDHDDYDHNGPIYDDQPDPLVEEIIRLEQKIFYFDEVLFAEGSWYEPPYSRDYTLFAEEQIEANKVAIRERAKLLESVRKEKEFERRLCEGSEMMQEMLDDFQRERLEAEDKADKLVNDLRKAIELKRSLQPQDPQLEEVNAQKEALEPKTNPEPSNHQVPVLEDSPSSTPSQKPESISTLVGATVVMLPEYPPSQVSTGTVVQEVEPTEGPDSEPPSLIQEKKEEEVLPMAINDHLLNCVEDTPPEESVLEEIEPITFPQDTNVQESEQESTGEEILCIEKPTPSIETCVRNASSEDSDQTFFDSLLDGCDDVCPKDGWSLRSWDELLMSDTEDSSMGEGTIIIIKPQTDSQPVEDNEEINLAMKANDVDQLRRLPPPPTYTKSPPYILLPPSRRDESWIMDLDQAKYQTRWHQKGVRRAKLYDSRIGKSRKKWMDVAWMIPHGNHRTLQNLEELPLHSEEARKKFLTWGNTKMLQPPMVLDPAYLEELGHWQDIDELLYDPKWRILLFLHAPASLEVTIEFLCSLRFLNDGEEIKTAVEVTSTTKVTFTLMGRLLNLTVADLGWLIGLYTLDETRSLAFANLPDQLDPEFDARKFWQAHGHGRFHSGASLARNWARPSWRILHQALALSYFGRSQEPDVVFNSDMLFFWSLEARVSDFCGSIPICSVNLQPPDRLVWANGYASGPRIMYVRSQCSSRSYSVDSRLRSMETLLLTQQWQVEEILDYVREQGTKKAEHGADQTFFDSLLDGCDDVCPKDGWSLRSRDELLMSDTEDSSMGESMVVIIKPQMDSQPIEDKEEINFAIKANDVDPLRSLPPPPTHTKSPPYFLLPPSRRDESRILDLD
ncbi:unnamed protein product [Cuscuta campestris]|uniref:Uncharacterized protein n=1 Tax=Cuscuta campestris TaxID=132261 RepID=A0A484N6Y4_9ASTE|nr:unnamed protein product [Cuscuta campestris]